MRAHDHRLRRRLRDGLFAGALATTVMTALLFSAPALAGVRVPDAIARLLASPRWITPAFAVHLSYGALAGSLFYGGARAVTLGRGALFGLTLWGVAAAVYAPSVGLGFVASAQPGLAAWALPAHLLYGLVLAACGFDSREGSGLTISENG